MDLPTHDSCLERLEVDQVDDEQTLAVVEVAVAHRNQYREQLLNPKLVLGPREEKQYLETSLWSSCPEAHIDDNQIDLAPHV